MIKNKTLIFLSISTISLLIGVGVYLNYFPKKLAETVIDPVLAPLKESLIVIQKNKQLTTEVKLEKTNEILDKLPPEYSKLKRQYQIAMSTLPDITFYGRVIDQYGQPISGASVGYIGTNAYLSAGGGRGKVMTDQDGYFEIDTVGATLNLGGIMHPDIEYAYQQNRINSENSYQDRLKLSKRFLSHVDNNGVYDNWRDNTEKDKAYIIHAWRLGEYEGALEGSINEYINSDGRQYTLNLLEKNYKTQVKEGLHEGHLAVSCTRKSMTSLKDYGDWAVTITPINGGIQETSDLYMNLAPVSGYQQSLTIDMKYGADDYKSSILNKRYYFTANNGKDYGSLFVHFMPHSHPKNNECRINIVNYKINPTGSRNLELKRQPTSSVKPVSLIQTKYAMAN